MTVEARIVGVGMVAVAGTVIGAMLPTPAYRLSVAWGEPVRDRCAACGVAVPAGPRGWLRVGSRCRGCAARNGPPAWLTAAVTAAACAGLARCFGAAPELVPFLALVPLGCLLGAIDLACMRLPDQLVLPGIGASLAAFGAVALVTGQWGDWGRAVLGGLAMGGAYLIVALVPGDHLGMGDVKLAALLGPYLGWLGWPVVIAGGSLPWAIHAPVGICLLVARRAARRAGRRAELPLGPAMLTGAYLAVVGWKVLAELLNG